jgi:hydroxyethylthiazole kinase-like uncharacterized protein yjeF
MRLLSTSSQMRQLDEHVIRKLGLPGIALMELAAKGVADAVRQHHAEQARRGVVVVCGPGNNGGDGWAVARWLAQWGYPVVIWSPAPPKPGTDAAVMREVALRQGLREVSGLGLAGLVVDALFGTGLTYGRELAEPFAGAVDAIAASDAAVVSVDVPSGLDADNGRICGRAVTADRTVTFGREKLGFFLAQGPDRVGEIQVVDIGLGAAQLDLKTSVAAEMPEASDLAPRWPRRSPSDHKGTLGHLLVIAGSTSMTGAAILACRGALGTGIGKLTLLATRPMMSRLAALPPEVMVLDGGPGDVIERLPSEDELSPFDAVAVGPGLGGGRPLPAALGEALSRAWVSDARPWVADADALPYTRISPAPRVLTPHPGEAARLLGDSTDNVGLDRMAAARRLAPRGVALLKGRYTVIAAEGLVPSINPTGSSALATGGSGDVLTGVIGALLARGVAPRDAARLGAFVHGRAGERLSSRRVDGWGASDIAAEIAPAIAELA